VYNYLIPSITSLPVGYDCHFQVATPAMAARLKDGTGDLVRTTMVRHEGEVVELREEEIGLSGGAIVGGENRPFHWVGTERRDWQQPGYLEIAYRTADDTPRFPSNQPLTPYAVYTAPERKSFFTDNAQKFSNPAIIAQIARYGQYMDTYPVVLVDRERDYGESLILINPYKKTVVARIAGHDDRALERVRVPAESARRVDLSALLREGETAWRGRIQLTANNRLVTYNVKHSLADPTVISDHEHLDPFRADPTHFPATQQLRIRAGALLGRLHGSFR
jgi:hypothetical protein